MDPVGTTGKKLILAAPQSSVKKGLLPGATWWCLVLPGAAAWYSPRVPPYLLSQLDFQSSRVGQFLDWLNMGLLTLKVLLISQLIRSNEVQPCVLSLREEYNALLSIFLKPSLWEAEVPDERGLLFSPLLHARLSREGHSSCLSSFTLCSSSFCKTNPSHQPSCAGFLHLYRFLPCVWFPPFSSVTFLHVYMALVSLGISFSLGFLSL